MKLLLPMTKGIVLPFLLFLLSFGLFTAYLLFASFLTAEQTYVAYALLYSSILLMFFVFVKDIEGSATREYGFKMPGGKRTVATIVLAVVLIAVFILIVLEPGFVFGFSRQLPPTLFTFGFFLFTAPLVAIAQEAVFRGYIFKKLLTRTTLSVGLLVSSLLFALQTTNPFVLSNLGAGGAVQYLFTNTLASFALGITMGLYFYKSGWSLLGPVIVRSGLLIQQNLSPIVANTTGWELTFVFQLMGFAALIILMNAFVKEPKLLAKKYLDLQTGPRRWRFLRRARQRSEAKRTLRNLAILGIILVSGIVGFQAVVGSSVHLVAIPTGSMRPTIYPGYLLVVQGVSSPGQIHVGDIIEFSPSWFNGSVVHRVVSEKQTSQGILYTTKGDNNTSPDPAPVLYSHVTGKVVLIIPYLGLFVLSPPLDVVLVAALFVSSLLGSSLKSPKPRMGPRSGW
jgi:signal peptidase I